MCGHSVPTHHWHALQSLACLPIFSSGCTLTHRVLVGSDACCLPLSSCTPRSARPSPLPPQGTHLPSMFEDLGRSDEDRAQTSPRTVHTSPPPHSPQGTHVPAMFEDLGRLFLLDMVGGGGGGGGASIGQRHPALSTLAPLCQYLSLHPSPSSPAVTRTPTPRPIPLTCTGARQFRPAALHRPGVEGQSQQHHAWGQR